jgi:CheY-like chemotaxis protein
MLDSSDVLRGKVLIVDDQQASVRLLEVTLRRAGYASVATTMDPTEVCDLQRKNRYDLILLDLQMPVMDGFRVLESLREMEKTASGGVSVLVMTAYPGHRERALEAGAKDFISKPFNTVEVLTRVYNILELRLLRAIHNQTTKTMRRPRQLISKSAMTGK